MCKNFKYFLSTEKLSEYISINIEVNTNFANNTVNLKNTKDLLNNNKKFKMG